MATYKVIQDIEAEDKLVGPFSLRQFIYLGVVVVLGFIAFQFAKLNFVLIIPFVPPIAFFGLLAAPIGTEQSSELWLLAKINFFIRPRKRIWNQDGVNQLVTITVPKKIEKHLTDSLSQIEVKSRLQALAQTLDSRGWALKNANVNLFPQESYLNNPQQDKSDRLVDAASLPQVVPGFDVRPSDDIMDTSANSTAQYFEKMIQTNEKQHRSQVINMVQPAKTPATPMPTIMPGGSPASYQATSGNQTAEDQRALEEIRHHQKQQQATPVYGHMKYIDPHASSGPANQQPVPPNYRDQNASGKAPDPGILRLANNDDLSVATIAREANRQNGSSDQEVVISLR